MIQIHRSFEIDPFSSNYGPFHLLSDDVIGDAIFRKVVRDYLANNSR